MEAEFLNSLYAEERRLFDALLPLYEDFSDIQKLITRRGGSPKCMLGGPDGFNSVTVQSVLNLLDTNVIAKINQKVKVFMDVENDYDKKNTWDKKTEYALSKLGKCPPKELIDFLCIQEGVGRSDKPEKEKISANIYNVLSKFYKAGRVVKDESDKEMGVQYELKAEAPLLSEAS